MAAFAVSGAIAGSASAAASELRCVTPLDGVGIDRNLAAVGSPLTGSGATFVEAAAAVGLDPRFLVAVAGHETIFETYGPARVIHNPFGLGPGWIFGSEAEAIRQAARSLKGGYLDEGRIAIAQIAPKWAPLGAANDPGGLNRSWTAGVGAYYAALGGDPRLPVLLGQQLGSGSCGPRSGAPSGTGAVVVWDGRTPKTGPVASQGGDPYTGSAATIDGFVFPLAAPAGATIAYRNDFTQPGALPGCFGQGWRCVTTILSAPGNTVAAPLGGRLEPATPAEAATGLAFWIRGRRNRIGLSGLAEYQPGVASGVEVRAGQALGSGTGTLLVAWERGGLRVNPHPMLFATRPSDLGVS